MTFLTLYLISIPVFIIGDLLWLGVIAKDFYFSRIGDLLLTPPNWYAAVAFYALFLLGLTFFVIHPGVTAGSLTKVLLTGAFFGLIAYATYDLTSLATLKNWSLTLTLVDMAWGAFLCAAVSGVTYSLYTLFS